MTTLNKKLSVIAPLLNEEEVVLEFYNRTKQALSSLTNNYEIIFVDDGSTDSTLSKLKEIHAQDKNVKVISFSRNFGHPMAISAGLDHVTGDGIMVVDADLQDPPELISDFVKKWQEGYEVVYGVRKKRKEWFGKRLAYWLFYRLLKKASSLSIPVDSGDFSFLDKKVVNVMKAMPERNRFLRGLRSWSGFRQFGLEYERAARFAGSTKYPFKKLLKLAADGIFSFSYIPLRLAMAAGFLVAGVAFLAILIVLYLRIFVGIVGNTGFASTIIAILFLGGIQLIAVGILGEYIGRIYDEVKNRPLYVVKEKIGL